MRPGTGSAKPAPSWIAPLLAALSLVGLVPWNHAAEPSTPGAASKTAAHRAVDPSAPPLPGEVVATLQEGR